MDPLEKREIGHTGLKLTRLGLGGAALGGIYGQTTDAEADETIGEALKLGIRYIDTAPLYGKGKSETRIGQYFRTHKKPSGLVLSTKVGRVLRNVGEPSFDYSKAGTLESYEESLGRLGKDIIDILYVHDPDYHQNEVMTQALKVLEKLRSTGAVKAIGAGMNQWEMEYRLAREGNFDCFLLAGKYSLLDQSADEKFLPYCREKGIGVVAGAPFNYGVLAADLRHGRRPGSTMYTSEAMIDRAVKIDAICAGHDVPVRTVALQFILAHPAITSVIPGSQTDREMRENLESVKQRVPSDLWDDLKQQKLIGENAPTP